MGHAVCSRHSPYYCISCLVFPPPLHVATAPTTTYSFGCRDAKVTMVCVCRLEPAGLKHSELHRCGWDVCSAQRQFLLFYCSFRENRDQASCWGCLSRLMDRWLGTERAREPVCVCALFTDNKSQVINLRGASRSFCQITHLLLRMVENTNSFLSRVSRCWTSMQLAAL